MTLSSKNFQGKIKQILLSLGMDACFYLFPLSFPSVFLIYYVDLKNPDNRRDIKRSPKANSQWGRI